MILGRTAEDAILRSIPRTRGGDPNYVIIKSAIYWEVYKSIVKSFKSCDRQYGTETEQEYFDNLPKSPGKAYSIIFSVCIVAFFIGLWFAYDLAGGVGILMYLVLVVGVWEGLYEASILLF